MATTARKAPAKTAEPAKRVRRTRAQIEADNLAEQAERERRAAERAARIPQPATPKFKKLFHFVNDGHTALGHTWFRGQEVLIEEGTPEFDLAFDRAGNFIFDKDDDEQIKVYGEVKYREGPWPGLPYDLEVETNDGILTLSPAERAALEKANRNRAKG